MKKNLLLAALRSSEFWVLAGQAAFAVFSTPVPEEMKVFGWLYILFRIAGKLAKYVFPNPATTDGGWFKKD